MARVVTYTTIPSGQLVSGGVSIANAKQVAFICNVLNSNPGSTMNLRIEAAMVERGGVPTSASFLPVRSQVTSANWHIHTAGSFAMSLAAECQGFDVIRFHVSSVLAQTTSLMVISQV